MTVLKKGSIELNLGIVKLGGDLEEDDRQCAWELYTELATRVAVTGRVSDPTCTNFYGELLVESLTSLYSFFGEARGIMRRFPVGKIGNVENHLGTLISRILEGCIRPFLERWHVDFQHWWEHQSNPRLAPMDRQREYPSWDEFTDDWTNLRLALRGARDEVAKVYKLADVVNAD